ncbi:MAG: uroporphyrinogen decarboxylase family protein [Promethearchaeota archaeon]
MRLIFGNTDKALMIDAGCNLFEWGSFLRRMDKFLIDLIRDQNNAVRLLDALMELHMSFLEKLCETVGDLVDIIKFGDDLGENNGPFMNPKIYKKIFKPRHTKLCKYVKNHSSAHTMLHCCGSINDLIPDLIEAGFEILNPVQINARNMNPKDLKENFGRNIIFWGGGADTRNVINRKTPKEVKTHVTELLEIFAPGGGYVWNTVHNILPDVPPKNIIAMFEAIQEYNQKL